MDRDLVPLVHEMTEGLREPKSQHSVWSELLASLTTFATFFAGTLISNGDRD